MQPDTRQHLVDLLVAARCDGRQITDLPAELVPATDAEGYAVNAMAAASLGWAPLGWKIAATTPQMQRRLRTTEPIYGRTFQRFAVPSPARFHHAGLLDPIVECEFFFRLGHDLPPRQAHYGRGEIVDAVAAVHAGVEVAECRFPLDRLPPMPAILADGAASGRYVIGDAFVDWRSCDFAAMPVSLSVNGTARRHGFGRDVMGDPVDALVWLANARSAFGCGLKRGELISTGTATGMLLARPGHAMRATFGDASSVDLTFDA